MSLFLSIALVHLVALVSPGPDFFFVSQTAVSRSRGTAFCGVLGIAAGVAVWAALALLGLQLLLHRLAWLERLIAVAGGLYLCWMGIGMLRAAFGKQAVPGAPSAPAAVAPGAWRAWRAGLLTNLANPKAVVYFGSVFSTFLGDGVGAGARLGLWTLVVAETVLWFSLVAAFFALPAMRRGYLRLARWIDGFAGAVFVLFGLHLVFQRRAV